MWRKRRGFGDQNFYPVIVAFFILAATSLFCVVPRYSLSISLSDRQSPWHFTTFRKRGSLVRSFALCVMGRSCFVFPRAVVQQRHLARVCDDSNPSPPRPQPSAKPSQHPAPNSHSAFVAASSSRIPCAASIPGTTHPEAPELCRGYSRTTR